MLDAALAYAALGIPVFPCNEDKSPLTPHGFKDATTNPEFLRRWWAKWPDAMIAMPTGPASGIHVIDIDRKNGRDGFAALPNWDCCSPVIVRTPSGAHLWFSSNETIPNTTSAIAAGVDTRGAGGYVIVPPSHNRMGVYSFEKGSEKERSNLPPFPAALRERLQIEETQHRVAGQEPQADIDKVLAALRVIRNDDLGWEEWNRVGMAAYRATRGRAYDGFDQFSQKSTKYNAAETLKRWRSFFKSPPTRIGAGTLFRLARQAEAGWEDQYDHALIERLHGEAMEIFETIEKLGWPAYLDSICALPARIEKLEAKADAEARNPSEPTTPLQLQKAKPAIKATPYVWLTPAQIPTRRWVYRPHYIRKFVSLTVSTGGIGKSSLLIVEAQAMASGKALLKIQPAQPLRVWYWNGEDPMEELQRRFVASAKHYKLHPEDIGDRLFVDSGRTMPIVIAEEAKFATRISEPVIEEVIEALRQNNIDVLIVDPFVSCHRVNENDNAAIERVAKSWSLVAEAANCAVMLAHHSRKTGSGDGVSVDDSRGASALLAAARTARTLNNMGQREAEDAEIDECERRQYFRSDIGKANLTRPAEGADWFQLVSVILENGEGDAVWCGDEVGVVTAWDYPDVKMPKITADDIRRAQAAMRAGGPWRSDQRASTRPWVGIPIAETLGLDLARKADKREVVRLVKDWVRAGYLRQFEELDDVSRKSHTYIDVGKPPLAEKSALGLAAPDEAPSTMPDGRPEPPPYDDVPFP